jgi:hypothetical protein
MWRHIFWPNAKRKLSPVPALLPTRDPGVGGYVYKCDSSFWSFVHSRRHLACCIRPHSAFQARKPACYGRAVPTRETNDEDAPQEALEEIKTQVDSRALSARMPGEREKYTLHETFIPAKLPLEAKE